MGCELPDLLFARASGRVDLQQLQRDLLRNGCQQAAGDAAGQAPAAASTTAAATLLDRRSPLVAGAAFFAPPTDRRRGAAACAAAAAAMAALRQHQRDEPVSPQATPAVDVPAALLARLPPPRLGDIAAPEPLPYDLRAAQQVRDLAAARPNSSGSRSSAAVELCAAGEPALPPVACPPAVAAQCGELGRLLEVLEEEEVAEEQPSSSSSGGGSPAAEPPAARRLVLPGVVPDEHAALCQLVGCLAGRTHAGRLEATLLLDVARCDC